MDELLEVCFEEDEKPDKRIAYSVFVGKKPGRKIKSVPVETFPCNVCTYSTGRKHDLKRHCSKVHAPDSKLKLKKRKNESKDEGEVIVNGKVKHSVVVKGRKRGPKMKNTYDRTFPCSLCTYVSTRRFDLKRHVSVVHNKEKPFSCDLCEFSAGLAETLKQHMLKVHKERKFKCDACEYSCLNQTEYIKHLMKEHDYMPHTCNACEFSCTTYLELKKHICREHKDIKPYKCNQCEYEACHKANLIKHTNYSHMKNVFFKCDVCNYQTNNGKYELAKHKRLKHKNKMKDTWNEKNNSFIFTCEDASQKKITEFYKCSICNFTTINGLNDLINHERLHNDINEKYEEEINKDFKNNQHGTDFLKNSKKSFTNDQLDDRLINQPSPNTNTKQIHTCDICPFSTKTYEQLTKHIIQAHMNNKIFSCSECNFDSPRTTNFVHHLKSTHGKTDNELEKIAEFSLKTVIFSGDSFSVCEDHQNIIKSNSETSLINGSSNQSDSLSKIDIHGSEGAHFLLGKPLLHNVLSPPTYAMDYRE